MCNLGTELERAILHSGMTKESACQIMNMTYPTLQDRFEDVSKLKFGEFLNLYREVDEDTRDLLDKFYEHAKIFYLSK